VKDLEPLKLTVQPAVPANLDSRLLSVHLWRKDRSQWKFEQTTVAAIRAAQAVWPLAMEAACAQGAQRVAGNLDWWEARWENRAFLEPLLDPDLPLRPMARLLLALGLGAKDPAESGLAVDACIASIADGRFDPEPFGRTMLQLWPSGLVKLSRWTKTLEPVARASPLHATAVRLAIETALRGDAKKAPKDLQSLLGLLQELVHETGTPAGPEARAFLSQVSGSGKAAKAAKAILAYSGETPAERLAEIMQAVVEARLDRARRWQERS
jgi:hypothetical protein